MTDEQVIIIDEIELRASTLSLRSDGIMHIHIKAVQEFLADDLMDMISGQNIMGGGKQFLNLLTFTEFLVIDKEARKLAATDSVNKYAKADAIVVNSIDLKLLVNFYIAFNKPNRPTRMFDSEEKAVEWLKTFIV